MSFHDSPESPPHGLRLEVLTSEIQGLPLETLTVFTLSKQLSCTLVGGVNTLDSVLR